MGGSLNIYWFIKYLLINCIGEVHVFVPDKFLQFKL